MDVQPPGRRVEDHGGSAAVISPVPPLSAPPDSSSAGPVRSNRSAWIVSPVFDLLFLANCGWLLLFLPGAVTRTDTAIDFWQVYFLTLPHRWLTLVLVVADPDRRAGQTWRLALIAAVGVLLVAGVYLGTGAFLCLAMVDYVWNAWHFGAQHAGVLRIYSRAVGGGPDWLERWGLRGFVVYAALRAAGWATGALEADAALAGWLRAADVAVLAIPVLLLAVNLIGTGPERIGKLAYLGSVCLLYSGFVISLSAGWGGLVLVFAAAASLFHAVEYLALVTHYASRRRHVGSDGAFRRLAGHWLAFLAVYAVVLGTVGVWASRPETGMDVLWQGLNLWAALVHYAFDGMIWKLRRPETAAALGLTGRAA